MRRERTCCSAQRIATHEYLERPARIRLAILQLGNKPEKVKHMSHQQKNPPTQQNQPAQQGATVGITNARDKDQTSDLDARNPSEPHAQAKGQGRADRGSDSRQDTKKETARKQGGAGSTGANAQRNEKR